jgi:hypothetical protein
MLAQLISMLTAVDHRGIAVVYNCSVKAVALDAIVDARMGGGGEGVSIAWDVLIIARQKISNVHSSWLLVG